MVTTGGLFMLDLLASCRCMLLTQCSLLDRSWPRGYSARATVIADAVHGDIIDDGAVDVSVVNDGGVYVGHCGVIGKRSMIPISAHVAHADIAKSIVDPAVEANVRTPVSGVPEIRSAAPAPITRRPKEAHSRRYYPCAGHPIITIRTISPIAGRPNVAWTGAQRLRIYRQRRRTYVH